MDPLSLQTLADYARGTLRGGAPGRTVSEISTDSRTLRAGDLFLALRGERFDGHDHVSALPARGAAGAVVARDYSFSNVGGSDFAWILVEDTLQAYHDIAHNYRRRQLAAVETVAITGSNGKTSTKDFTAAVLARRGRVLRTEGNLNNHVGVPRTILRGSATDRFAVIELGMNHPGEIAPLARMAAPRVGIITNIGTAHLEYMGTREAIAQEKGTLAEAVGADGFVLLTAEDDFTRAIADRTAATVRTVGLRTGDLRAENLTETLAGSRFTAVDAGGARADAFLPVPGAHMVTNALLAIAAGQALGLSLPEAAAGLADARLTRGRLEVRTVRGLSFLDDSYNANPESMVAALRTLARMPVSGRRFAVLGRMGELGVAAAEGYRRVGRTAADAGVGCLIGVGPETSPLVQAANAAGNSATRAHLVADTAEAARLLVSLARPGDLILLKGSRSAAMENVLRDLEAHPGAPSSAAAAAVAATPAP